MNREKKRFWIGFDGFDSFGYNFDTKEEAEAYLDKHHAQLIRYCEHCVEIYDRGLRVKGIGPVYDRGE